MKQVVTVFTALMFVLLILGSNKLIAQTYTYLDVPEGYETLNKAITEDLAAPANRAYRLQRNGTYLLNGTISLKGRPLVIVGAEGTGRLPMIITTANLSGVNYRPFNIYSNTTIKNVYISGRNNLGVYTDDGKDIFRIYEIGVKVTVDNVFIEHEWKDFFRIDAKDVKLFIKNSTFRNGGDLADGSDNQYIDTRSQDVDTIFVQNSTFYTSTGRGFRTGGKYFRTFIMDHNTFYQGGNGDAFRGANDSTETPYFDVTQVRNFTCTNNLLIDLSFHGDEINTKTVNDTLDGAIFGFTRFVFSDKTDADRNIKITNNVYGSTPELLAYYKSVDTLKAPVLLNKYSLNRFFNKYPSKWIQKDNILESLVFPKGPTPDLMLKYTKALRAQNFTETNMPAFWADKNGIGEDPSTWGPAVSEYSFEFAKTYKAYYSGEKGFPVGDLNWFPDRKKIWETGGSVGIEHQDNTIVTEYSLEQNYPNPFNPSTIISFSIPKATNISLKIFNMLGQEIATLVNNEMVGSGKYNVEWNGKDAANHSVATGVYIYQLKADNTVISKKMMLVK